MTLEQCAERNQAIYDNAVEWANERPCMPLEQFDIVVLGDILDMWIPKGFNNFILSKKINHALLTGAEKTILKTLDRIKEAILEREKVKAIQHNVG